MTRSQKCAKKEIAKIAPVLIRRGFVIAVIHGVNIHKVLKFEKWLLLMVEKCLLRCLQL